MSRSSPSTIVVTNATFPSCRQARRDLVTARDVAERGEGGDGVGPAPRGRRAVDATGRQPAPSNSGLAWRISPTVSDPQTLDALDASPLDPGDS